MIRILVVDDHAVVRRGVREILLEGFPGSTVGEAQSVPELFEALRTGAWQAVVLDISLPGRSGLEALAELRTSHPHLPVLVLSVHPEDQFGVRVLRAGASGYLTKESAPDELVAALQRILGGGTYVSPALAALLVTHVRERGDRSPHALLSDREFEVLCAVAAGKRVTDIANELALSVKTVSTYRARILEKLGLHSNADLTRYALDHELLR